MRIFSFLTAVSSLVAVALSATIPLKREDLALSKCGPQYYDKSQYTCCDGLLCPVIEDVRYLRCGVACYNLKQYRCDGEVLMQIAPEQKPPETASKNTTLHGNGSIPAITPSGNGVITSDPSVTHQIVDYSSTAVIPTSVSNLSSLAEPQSGTLSVSAVALPNTVRTSNARFNATTFARSTVAPAVPSYGNATSSDFASPTEATPAADTTHTSSFHMSELKSQPCSSAVANSQPSIDPGSQPSAAVSPQQSTFAQPSSETIAQPTAEPQPQPAPVPDSGLPGWRLDWSDEFDGNALDQSKWNIVYGDGCPELCNWGNGERQTYDSSQISVANSLLTITASRVRDKWMSAKITTQGKMERAYGRFEARLRFSRAQGSFPAFWMLPSAGQWPYTGEIDIIEYQSAWAPNLMRSTVHMSSSPGGITVHDENAPTDVASVESEFHNYAVEWSPQQLVFLRDGVNIGSHSNNGNYNDYPFGNGQPFYLILNMAIGPWFGSQTLDNSDIMLQADWVRVYTKI